MKLTDEIVKALNGCISDGYESVQEFARLTNISAETLAKFLKKEIRFKCQLQLAFIIWMT